jgi:hypothetical protein
VAVRIRVLVMVQVLLSVLVVMWLTARVLAVTAIVATVIVLLVMMAMVPEVAVVVVKYHIKDSAQYRIDSHHSRRSYGRLLQHYCYYLLQGALHQAPPSSQHQHPRYHYPSPLQSLLVLNCSAGGLS